MELPHVPMPTGMRDEDWRDLVSAGSYILETLAENALILAERKNQEGGVTRERPAGRSTTSLISDKIINADQELFGRRTK
jgi:hypothetical protein